MPKRVPFLCVLLLVFMEAARYGAALGGDVEAIKGDLERSTSDTPSGALLLAQFGMWGVYKGSDDGKKVCFAQSKPFTSESNPPNRNPVYMFISSRPADKVINEISLMIGYRFKAGSEATAQIGGSTFRLFTHQDRALVKNVNEQAKMVHAMRNADSVLIKGVSAKGRQSIDTFTLQGFGDAIDRAYQECIATEPQESADKFIVQMKDDGGVFVVPVEINSAITLDFVVDSGASDVSIPADVISVLIRRHTIQASDFIGKQTYVLADGSEAPSTIFMIRSLKIGDHLINDIRGSIAPATGSLLLGQSFLQKFRSWSIDNTKHVLVLE